MRFDQTKDVLRFVESFHEDISQAYAELGGSVPDRRTKLLLDYMSVREAALAEAVRSFSHGSTDPSLREWDPMSVDESSIRARLKKGLDPGANPEQLLELGLEVAEWFEQLYVRLQAKSGTPEQKALFANLHDRTVREKNKLARNANMLMDF
jgi:hypothetical protein